MHQGGVGEAIAQGGTTFRDYVDANGNPGYFAVALATGKTVR